MSPNFRYRAAFPPIVLAVACSSNPVAPPPPDTQERLAPWTLQADGAPPVPIGILDRTEQVHCTFASAADGRLRCLPVALLVTTGWFADASCTEPLFSDTTGAWQSGVHPRAGRIALPRVACEPERFEVRTLQPATNAQPSYSLDEGKCVPSALPSTINLFSTGAVVPPERWEPGEEVDGARVSDRLRFRDVVSSTGTHFPDHLVDDHWNMRCDIPSASESCWPASLADKSEFADETCTQPIFSAASACESPAFIGNQGSRDLFALGPRWTGPMFRQTKGCSAIGNAPADNPPFTQGAPLGPGAVAPAPLQPAGSARVQPYVLRDASGTPIAAPLYLFYQRWMDTVAHEDCRLEQTRTAGIRCVPLSVASTYDIGYFTDAACTRRALLCSGDCSGDVVIEGTLRTNVQSVPSDAAFTNTSGTCVRAEGAPLLVTGGTETPWEKYALVPERNALPD